MAAPAAAVAAAADDARLLRQLAHAATSDITAIAQSLSILFQEDAPPGSPDGILAAFAELGINEAEGLVPADVRESLGMLRAVASSGRARLGHSISNLARNVEHHRFVEQAVLEMEPVLREQLLQRIAAGMAAAFT